MVLEAVKKEMQARKHTVSFLARETGLTQPQLWNWINGKTHLNVRSLEKICNYYDLKLYKTFD